MSHPHRSSSRPLRRVAAGLTLALSLALSPVAAAEPGDWESPESIVHALYEVISAEAGAQRDWDRYRALFLDGARMSIAVKSDAMTGIMSTDTEALVAQTESAYANTGFHEIPLVTRVERHDLMASVTSSFEIRLRLDDDAPLMRGINHFQLLNDGERWWIVSNIGVIETDASPLPPELLPAAGQGAAR